MTEAEWLACEDARAMVGYAARPMSERQLKLFACACCRRVEHLLLFETSRTALVTVEEAAEGLIPEVDVGSAGCEAHDTELRIEAVIDGGESDEEVSDTIAQCGADGRAVLQAARAAAAIADSHLVRHSLPHVLGSTAAAAAWSTASGTYDPAAGLAEQKDQVRVLRDIFGNPFRPVAFAPEWRTGTAVTLARQMYESRDFGAMAILADALQDAGCDSDEVLRHCREPGTHVRGCWVCDLVLGKE
jgi:hypothetical protein